MSYTYYRAMSREEYSSILEDNYGMHDPRETYWADCVSVAKRYLNPERVLVELTLDRPINPDYLRVAEYVSSNGDNNNHYEYCMARDYFWRVVLPSTLDIGVVA